MGREATTTVTIADATGRTLHTADEVHVVLESSELILRGPLRRRFALPELVNVTATADLLRFRAADELVEIELPPAVARRWAEKITAPPPTLAHKLGLSAAAPLLIGDITDPELLRAVTDAGTAIGADAAVEADVATIAEPSTLSPGIAIAEVDDEPALLAALRALPAGVPVWLVHRKGRGEWLSDTAIRAAMRSRGFVDTKVSSVSQSRTATRYVERRAQPPPGAG